MEPAPAKVKPQGRPLLSTQLDAKDELEELGRSQANSTFLTNNPDKPSRAAQSFLQPVQKDTADQFYQPAWQLAAR